MKTGQFYSAFALRQLAIQKHGSFDGPVGFTEVKRLERARRVAVVDVATLLHGGSHHASDFSNQQDFDAGWFSEEFVSLLVTLIALSRLIHVADTLHRRKETRHEIVQATTPATSSSKRIRQSRSAHRPTSRGNPSTLRQSDPRAQGRFPRRSRWNASVPPRSTTRSPPSLRSINRSLRETR